MALNSGSKVGPYEILSSLGAGGMGEVYRARDTRLGREVALKILPESFSHAPDRLHRFEQEARAVAALDHPNILAIHDIGEADGGAPFIVSELLEGSTLRAQMEHGPLPPRKAAELAIQIAQGLSAAHEKSIIHRDLKPENVFVTREGRIKILDFGLAKLAPNGGLAAAAGMTATGSPTEAGTVMGTVGYMAPEQVRGATVDSRTDIFAFGTVLYEMVSGRRAFRRDTNAETMTAILNEDPADLSDIVPLVPPAFERIVRRCLEKEPAQRFQSAKDVAFALEAMSGSSSKASLVPASAARNRGGWLAISMAVSAGLLVGAGLVWMLRPGRIEPPTFKQVSFERGEVLHARFAPDGKSVTYGAKLNGGSPDTYVIREDYPESVSSGLHGAVLAAVSRQGQMAVITNPVYYAHRQWKGTLATSPISGGAPREILENVYDADFSPDGQQLAVIDRDPSGNWRLQYPIGKILVSGDGWLSDVRVSPDGRQVALFQHPPNVDDRGVVLLVDSAGKVHTISQEWESLEGLAWSPSGKEVWYSAAESGSQYCIRAASLQTKPRTVYCGTTGTIIQDVAPDGRVLVSSESLEGRMSMLQHATSQERDLSWLDYPYGPSLSEAGDVVLFTDQSGQAGSVYTVYVRKTDGSPAVRISVGGFGTDLSPDGKWATVLLPGNEEGKLHIVPIGAGQARAFHWPGIRPLWAVWFPDNRRILMNASENGKAAASYVTDVDGTAPKLIAKLPSTFVRPRNNLFFAFKDGSAVIASLSDETTMPIANLLANEFPIEWSAEPDWIFTKQLNAAGCTIFKLNWKTGRRQLWQIIKPADQVGLVPMVNPIAITPDGNWMAFTFNNRIGKLFTTDDLR